MDIRNVGGKIYAYTASLPIKGSTIVVSHYKAVKLLYNKKLPTFYYPKWRTQV